MSSSTVSWQMSGSQSGAPASHSQQPQKPTSGIAPRAGTQVVYVTNNYSIAPGPAWLELVNKAAFSPTGTVTIAIPVRGAGDLLANLNMPLGVAVVGPTVMTGLGVPDSGMSPQGFPSLPRAISAPSVLPATLGINGATINTAVSPHELNITFVGSGSVPANSRWLVFTITGV